METLKSTKVDWKKITVVGALVILSAITVGGLTWYTATTGAQDELEAYKNDIVRLETEIKQLQADEVTTEEEATGAKDETAGWKTYSNDSWGISLKYPSTFSITENTVKNPGATMAGILSFVDSTRTGKPSLNMLFNPDGIGGCMLDANDYSYSTAIADNKLNVTKKIPQTTSDCPDNSLSKTMFDIGKADYAGGFKNGILASFVYSQGSFQGELDQIIDTIVISKPELYGS